MTKEEGPTGLSFFDRKKNMDYNGRSWIWRASFNHTPTLISANRVLSFLFFDTRRIMANPKVPFTVDELLEWLKNYNQSKENK